MKPTLSSVRDVLTRNAPGLTLEALDSVLGRKLFELVEQRIKDLIVAQLGSMTLPELISLHKELLKPKESPVVGFKSIAVEGVSAPVPYVEPMPVKPAPKPKAKTKKTRVRKNSKGW